MSNTPAGGAAAAPASGAAASIDLNRYGRQVGVFGLEAMGKLITLDVLVIGLRGVGVEVAKNLILAGPRSVTLFDPEPATIADCGSNVRVAAAAAAAARARARVQAHRPPSASPRERQRPRRRALAHRRPLPLSALYPSAPPRSTTSRPRPWGSRAPRPRSRSWAR
jgi:hypothetical protein